MLYRLFHHPVSPYTLPHRERMLPYHLEAHFSIKSLTPRIILPDAQPYTLTPPVLAHIFRRPEKALGDAHPVESILYV